MQAAEAVAQIRASAALAKAKGKEQMTICVPEGQWLPRDFPQRKFLCINPGGVRSYSVSIKGVIDWLHRHRLA